MRLRFLLYISCPCQQGTVRLPGGRDLLFCHHSRSWNVYFVEQFVHFQMRYHIVLRMLFFCVAEQNLHLHTISEQKVLVEFVLCLLVWLKILLSYSENLCLFRFAFVRQVRFHKKCLRRRYWYDDYFIPTFLESVRLQFGYQPLRSLWERADSLFFCWSSETL